MPDSLALNVRSVLAERGSDPGDLVLKPIPGGASRETWLVEGDESRWVLRRDPEGSVSLVPIEDEFALITQAHEAGVPVPQPVLSEPRGSRFGSAGMLMSFVEGTSVAPRILRKPEFEQARARLTAQLGDALARIHSLPVSEVGALLPAVEGDPALAQIEMPVPDVDVAVAHPGEVRIAVEEEGLQRRQVDVLFKTGRLAPEILEHAPQLLFLGRDVRRQQAAQVQGVALGFGEGGSLVERRILQQGNALRHGGRRIQRFEALLQHDVEMAARIIAGTARSMGVEVEA